jgi:hypothetical protein
MRSLHTPQQETNVAYNPGVSYRGGEFIAQGISQAGNAISAGLQRYAQNREESAALDMSFQTRAQPLLEEMQKFSAKDGQVSPAAGLVDKGADWHKFSSSQKKAFLADVVIMGDKQDRARRQQQDDDFRKAAQQFQQDQFAATERHRRFQEGQSAMDTLFRGIGAFQDARRFGLTERSTTLAEKTQADTLARLGRVEAERGADRNAYRSMLQFAQPMQPGDEGPMPSMQFNAARAMQQTGGNIQPEDIAALEKMGRISRVGTMTDIAGDPSGKFLWQADNAGYRVPTGKGNNPDGDMPPARDGFAPFPDGRGGFTWKAIKKADGTVAAAIPAEMQTKMDTLMNEITEDEAQIAAGDARSWYGGSRADRLKENKARLAVFQRNYGGAPASGPASGGSRFKVEEIK